MRFATRVASELDNPARWNQYLKPYFDTRRFQQSLDDRVGVNRDGKSIVVLRWAQDVVQRVWSEETPRYWLRRRKAEGTTTYYRVARWVLEVRLEPALYMPAWEATRYSLRDPTTGSPRCDDCGCTDQPVLIKNAIYCPKCVSTNIVGGAVVDKGPPPDDYFSFMLECARHESPGDDGWPACCTRAFYADTKWGGPHSRCWGDYRQPTEDDLGLAAQTIRETANNPYEPLSPMQLAETELAANKQAERAEQQFAEYENEIMRDNMNRWMAGRVYSGAGGPSHKPLAIQDALAGRSEQHT